MPISFRGVPIREVNGLPYAVHQIGENQWQIAIQNCARHPAGYSFAPVYGSRDEAMQALDHWPVTNFTHPSQTVAGDDTGAAEYAYFED